MASSVTLAWDPSPDPSVVSYTVYYGIASGSYTNLIIVGNVTNATVSTLVPGTTYYFAATATSSTGLESDFSNEVSYAVPVAQPPNQPPTLNALANRAVNENAGLQTVNLSGISSGATNEAQSLTVTASSSNAGLIPNPAVSYANPATTGSLSFTPVPDAYGTATVTVTVNDGAASNNVVTRSFVVTVNPVNDVPTLNALANVMINENAGLQTVNLSGISSGAANEAQSLTVTASSSNAGLIPNPAVSYASPATTGSLSFTPVRDAYGAATVTVRVNDGGASNNIVTRSFTITVNRLPTISAITNYVIAVDAQIEEIPFTISDAETAVENLVLSAHSSNVTLVEDADIVFAGAGTNRMVTVTPLPGQSGSTDITITVSDGIATSSRTFELKVMPRPAPPGTFRVVSGQ